MTLASRAWVALGALVLGALSSLACGAQVGAQDPAVEAEEHLGAGRYDEAVAAFTAKVDDRARLGRSSTRLGGRDVRDRSLPGRRRRTLEVPRLAPGRARSSAGPG